MAYSPAFTLCHREKEKKPPATCMHAEGHSSQQDYFGVLGASRNSNMVYLGA